MARKKTAKRKDRKANSGNGVSLSFLDRIWAATGRLRDHMGASEHRRTVMGLTFLRHVAADFGAWR